ncbi:outer membrane protein [Lutibacter agarilyticus]|uniref:Outer membrane protein n=1 Tax=Lutibacter agarilyticus TaxID=1109740 RepID=A0A238XB89_9FLAO|nr:TolC family protein [Lutibacter agarilyticus]SNR55813.1 outer membrane protein [Lutibacter agarilyticus]
MRTKIVTILAVVFFMTLNAQDKKWSLQECVDYALENNISIKQQELNTELVGENVLTARGNFYPSLNGSATQNWNFGSYIGQTGLRISRDTRGNSFGLNSGVNIYNGNRNRNILEQAKNDLEAAGYDLEENKNTIMLFIVNSYLNVLLNKENLKIAEDQIVISENQVKEAQGLVESGSKAKSVLLEAEATLATNNQQLTTAQNTLNLSLLSLAQLLQMSHKGFDVEDVLLNMTSEALKYKNTDDIFEKAVSILPEIKSAELALESSELDVKIAKGAYQPTLGFGAGLGTSYQHARGESDQRPIIDPDDPTNIIFVPNGFGEQLKNNMGYNLGFSLSVPIFNRFQTKSNVNRAIINQERAALQLLDRELKLRESIEKAYADAKAALDQFVSSEISLKAQQELFKNAQASYNSGVMTSFDFDQVRNRLVNAQSTMVNAKYNFVFRTKLLEYYYGIPIVM